MRAPFAAWVKRKTRPAACTLPKHPGESLSLVPGGGRPAASGGGRKKSRSSGGLAYKYCISAAVGACFPDIPHAILKGRKRLKNRISLITLTLAPQPSGVVCLENVDAKASQCGGAAVGVRWDP